jgi:hypothetical protein
MLELRGSGKAFRYRENMRQETYLHTGFLSCREAAERGVIYENS